MRLTAIINIAPALLLLACNGGQTATESSAGSSSETGATTSPTTSTSTPTTSGEPGTGSATDGTGSATGGTTSATTSGTTGEPGTGGTTESVDTTGGTAGTTGGTSEGTTGGTTSGDTTSGDTTSGTTSGTTGGESSGGTDETGGNIMGCNFDGPEVEATLVHDGKPPPPCGTIEFEGQLAGPGTGPVYALDGCPCGANCLLPDPWTFTVDVPDGLVPGWMPECPRVVVQRQMSKMGCELVGAAVFDAEGSEHPLWVAGSLLGPIDAITSTIAVTQEVVEECDCDFCCNVPQRLDLVFTVSGDTQAIPEGGDGVVGKLDASYGVHNFQSHLTGLCDASPSIDYMMQKVFP